MGNKQSIIPETQGTVSMERYTSTVYKYGGGKYKTYTSQKNIKSKSTPLTPMSQSQSTTLKSGLRVLIKKKLSRSLRI